MCESNVNICVVSSLAIGSTCFGVATTTVVFNGLLGCGTLIKSANPLALVASVILQSASSIVVNNDVFGIDCKLSLVDDADFDDDGSGAVMIDFRPVIGSNFSKIESRQR